MIKTGGRIGQNPRQKNFSIIKITNQKENLVFFNGTKQSGYALSKASVSTLLPFGNAWFLPEFSGAKFYSRPYCFL